MKTNAFFTNNLLFLSILLSLLGNCMISQAAVTVTAANATCLDVSPGPYTSIGTIILTENLKGDFAGPQTNTTLILTCPGGFQFNPGIGTVGYTAGRNITAASVVVTATSITVTLSVSSNSKFDVLSINNVQARGIATNNTGNILRVNPTGGGTATISGDAVNGAVTHGYLTAKGTGATIASISPGNWSNAAIWSTGKIPSCTDNVVINHALVGDGTSSINNLTINTSSSLTANNAITVAGTFTINGTGTYTHNNSVDASVTIFMGSENFSTTSQLIFNAWYDQNVPLGLVCNGNFGNITMNVPLYAWDQDGLFAPNRIKGSFSVTDGEVIMDDGTGLTTTLTLQEVIISGNGSVSFSQGTNRNLTLVTNNFTDISSSSIETVLMYQSHGVLNFTCNGNLSLGHDFSAQEGMLGTEIGSSILQINGDLNISGGYIDFNRLINGNLNLTVTGNTTISGNPGWVRFMDSGAGTLTYNTNNLYITGGSSNTIMAGNNPTGAANITINNDFTQSGTSTLTYLVNYSVNLSTITFIVGRDFIVTGGSFRTAYSGGTITMAVARDLIVNGSTSSFYGQRLSSATAQTNVAISRNLTLTSGIYVQSLGRGDITLNVEQTMQVNSGTFYGISSSSSGNYGNAAFVMNRFDFNGGITVFHSGYITNGRTVTINCTTDFDLNFASAADGVVLINVAGSNNAKLNLQIGGNFVAGGNSSGAYFYASAGGDETVNITGNMSITGGDVWFNGDDTPYGNAHNNTLSIGGNLTVSGGNLRLSSLAGTAIVNIGNNVTLSGGTTTLKWDIGNSTMTVLGNFTQTAGIFNFHSRSTADNSSVANVIINGMFSQMGGTMNFDSRSGNNDGTNTLTINGSSYSIGGNAIMTHANHLSSNTVYGNIIFNRNGTINYNRASNTHDLQQVRQTVSTGTTLDISSSTNNMQLSSHQSSTALNHNSITVNGAINTGTKEIFGRAQANYYAMITLNAGSRLSTANSGGFYSGSVSASALNPMISGNNRMNFSLSPTSIIEYNGTDNQIITGIPNGIATGTQHKYGILNINFSGTADTEFIYPEANNEVFIRTSLILNAGELNLDNDHLPFNSGGKTITLENGATLTRTNGYIRSEVADGSAIVKWNITSTGSFTFPFGYNSMEYIPFTFAPTSGISGDVSLGTYHTSLNNTPYPPGVTHVNDLTGMDNSANMVDRFWNLVVTGSPTADLTYTATSAEFGSIANPGAQLWTPAGPTWEPSAGIQSNPTFTSTLSSGISTFSIWWSLAPPAAGPLPVELIIFQAECIQEKAFLSWTTASETNNNFFTIERSADGKNFSELARISGLGNSSNRNEYSYIDQSAFTGINYYRLKQTDFNGNVQTLKTVSLNPCKMQVEENPIQVVPSLFSQFFSAQYILPEKQNIRIQLINMMGMVVYSENILAETGKNTFTFSNQILLSDGIYFFQLSNSKEVLGTVKIVCNK